MKRATDLAIFFPKHSIENKAKFIKKVNDFGTEYVILPN